MFYTPSHVFVDFVDKLLNVELLDATSVEKVALNCEEVYDKDKIVSWVCAALRLNVQHLRVMSYLGDSKALIGSLNGCTTLMALELGKEFELCLPKELVLPNLKRLSLYSLSVGNDRGALHGLLNSCPVLNELRLNGCDLSYLGTLYIEHPSLKKLFMDGSFNDDECRVVINVPNLEAFAFGGHFVATYVLVNTKLLRSVYTDYDYLNEENHGNKLRSNSCSLAKLIKACSSTTRLRLRGNSVSGLSFFWSVSLPIFQNLTCLALGRMGNHGLEMLARFLESAPNLTMLTFEEELEFTYYKARWKTFKSSFVCMELHVKKIEIWEFKWTSNEIGLIEYFLKNGRVLEELTIYCLPCENASNLEKISILPRHSEACQVLLKDKKERRACSRESWFQTGHE